MPLTIHAVASRALDFVGSFLPDHLAAQFDTLFPIASEGFGGPFNGQRCRVDAITGIFEAIPFQTVIETGTYRGTTTALLVDLTEAPVVTIEAQRRFFLYAERRFGRDAQVTVLHGDSADVLRDLAIQSPWDRSPAFFYLDAHWLDRLPLVDELEAITTEWADVAIVIDDFRVPGDPGYGFDTYGGTPLDLDLVRSASFTDLAVYWPTAPSHDESGARRGWVVLGTPGIIDQRLQTVPGVHRAGVISGRDQPLGSDATQAPSE